MTREAEPDALARLYDLDLGDDAGDLDLYLALAQRTGGPILELAVGTGRLAVPIAAAGYAVTGVDLDPAMLDRARARAAAAGVEITGSPRDELAAASGGEAAASPGIDRPASREPRRNRGSSPRLELIEADATTLDLSSAGSYKLAFVALSSLLLFASRHSQRAALQVLAHHLAPGGLAVVDITLPDADDLARYDGRLALESIRTDPGTGRVVTKLSSARHEPANQVVTLTTIFEEGLPGEPVVRWTRTDRLRLLSGDELVGLAEAAGLVIEQLAGGYDLEPIGAGAERAVLVAARR
jgi:SAM-dependent methyltransferase